MDILGKGGLVMVLIGMVIVIVGFVVVGVGGISMLLTLLGKG